jgi:tetratricopeptide (TPR) repeat protein
MKQAQFGQAIHYFNRANDLAPANIERLCNLAVTQASAADTEAAEESLSKARSIAEDEFIIDETEVKLGLINGQVERARTFMEGFRHSSDLIAFINNRGVWLSTQGRLTDGIQLYETALQSLTENLKEIEPVICYNIALAHIKSGNTKKALEFIKKNSAASSSELSVKISSLGARLTKALQSGEQITLNNKSSKAPATPQHKDLSWLDPGIDPGTARLYGIFNSGEPVSPVVLKMFENMPRYGKRHGLAQPNPNKRHSS